MRRYALRDDQWDRIQDFLPGREGHGGRPGGRQPIVRRSGFVSISEMQHPVAGSSRAVSAIGEIVHQRFGRWAKSGVFDRVLLCWRAITTTNT